MGGRKRVGAPQHICLDADHAERALPHNGASPERIELDGHGQHIDCVSNYRQDPTTFPEVRSSKEPIINIRTHAVRMRQKRPNRIRLRRRDAKPQRILCEKNVSTPLRQECAAIALLKKLIGTELQIHFVI